MQKARKSDRAKTVGKKPAAPRLRHQYVLRLFVAGATARSREAVLRIQRLCAIELKDNCDLEVIDIYQQPGLARENQIVATPTLIIEFPRPVRRFIGNLVGTAGLVVALDLAQKGKIVL
jgi:circadian clock protein KaiB